MMCEKVGINGRQVFAWRRGGPEPHGTSSQSASRGRNTVLVKIENLGASWQLYLSIHDPEWILSEAIERQLIRYVSGRCSPSVLVQGPLWRDVGR